MLACCFTKGSLRKQTTQAEKATKSTSLRRSFLSTGSLKLLALKLRQQRSRRTTADQLREKPKRVNPDARNPIVERCDSAEDSSSAQTTLEIAAHWKSASRNTRQTPTATESREAQEERKWAQINICSLLKATNQTNIVGRVWQKSGPTRNTVAYQFSYLLRVVVALLFISLDFSNALK